MNIDKQNIIVLVMGKSGSGKDTLVDRVCNQSNTPDGKETIPYVVIRNLKQLLPIDTNLSQVISWTTRPRREGEKDTHKFIHKSIVSECNFPNDDTIAWTEYHGYHYWAFREQLEENDLYIIDPQGVDYLLNKYTGNKMPIVLYLDTHWWIRFKRIAKRNNIIYAIKRIWNDRKTFKDANIKADYVLKNNTYFDLDKNREEIIKLFYKNVFFC